MMSGGERGAHRVGYGFCQIEHEPQSYGRKFLAGRAVCAGYGGYAVVAQRRKIFSASSAGQDCTTADGNFAHVLLLSHRRIYGEDLFSQVIVSHEFSYKIHVFSVDEKGKSAVNVSWHVAFD